MARRITKPRVKLTISIDYLESSLYSLDNPGVCIACGQHHEGCEPDAENYICEECGNASVYGLEQAMLCGFLEITEGAQS